MFSACSGERKCNHGFGSMLRCHLLAKASRCPTQGVSDVYGGGPEGRHDSKVKRSNKQGETVKKNQTWQSFGANDANTWKWPNIRPSLAFSLARLRKKHQQVTKGERGGPGRTEENRGGPRRTEEVPRSSEEVPRKFRGSSEEVPRKNRGGPRRGSRGPKRLREAST